MKIALQGKRALFAGANGALATALAEALRANGATLVQAGDGADCDLFVGISAGAESGPVGDADMVEWGEAELFARLARTGAGRVRRAIFVISAAAIAPVRGAAMFSAHQAALASLAQSLAMELAPDCLVNALAVGAVGATATQFVSHSALRRPAALAEIVPAALFLANPRNTYTTGHVMSVDGGWSAGYARNF